MNSLLRFLCTLKGVRIPCISLAVLLLCFCLVCMPVLADSDLGSIPDAQPNPAVSADVEAFFDAAIPAELAKYNIPGATVAAVYDGKLIFSKGYGYADITNRTPVDAGSTLFHIGSVTKLFTWTCVMQLVDEGKIDLDADINTYLADFSLPDTYPGQPVTMRNLMTHTAGFEDEARGATVESVDDLISFRNYCRDYIPARVYPPGTVTSYSNYGTTLAAVVVEDVSGMPFEQYLQENILTPLSLKSTHLSYLLPPDSAVNLSSGYNYIGGTNAAITDTIFVIGPAGSISSTAEDMAVFLAAHMQNGKVNGAEILSEPAAALMHARAFTNDPRVSGICLGFYENYLNGERIILHGGDTNTFHSLFVIIPDKKTGFFVSYNAPGGTSARDDLLVEYVGRFYPVTETKTVTQEKEHSASFEKYAGVYQSNRHNYRTFEFFLQPPQQMTVEAGENNTCLVLNIDGASTEYIEVSPGVFQEKSGAPSVYGNMVFRENGNGDVTFLCSENTPVLAYERVPWYAVNTFTSGLLSAAMVLLFSVFIWPVMAFFQKIYGKRSEEEAKIGLPFYARLTAFIAAVLSMFFVFCLYTIIQPNEELIMSYLWNQTPPLLLTVILTIPVICAVLSVATAGFTFVVWKMKFWNVWQRIHFTLVTIGLFMLMWWMNYLNLFIFRL